MFYRRMNSITSFFEVERLFSKLVKLAPIFKWASQQVVATVNVLVIRTVILVVFRNLTLNRKKIAEIRKMITFECKYILYFEWRIFNECLNSYYHSFLTNWYNILWSKKNGLRTIDFLQWFVYSWTVWCLLCKYLYMLVNNLPITIRIWHPHQFIKR